MGKKRTPEQKERYSLAAKKRWADPELRKKMKDSMAKRSQNEEYLEKVSAGVKAWCQENPDKLAARQSKIASNIIESGILRGRKRPEHSAYMKAKNLERWSNPEWKAEQLIGRQDPVYKEAISEGLRRAAKKPGAHEKRSRAAKRMWDDPKHDSLAHAKIVAANGIGRRYEYLDRFGRLWNLRSGPDWELGFARWLDRQKLTWSYEPCVLLLSTGERYIPDFWVEEWQTYVEIKGTRPGSDRKGQIAYQDGHPVLMVRTPQDFMIWAR